MLLGCYLGLEAPEDQQTSPSPVVAQMASGLARQRQFSTGIHPFPPSLPLIHSPTHPEPGRQPRSRGPAASSPRSWTSSCGKSRRPRVPRSRRLRTRSGPGLGAFSSPSCRGSGVRKASGPS